MQLFRVVRDNNITLKLTRIRHETVKRFGKNIDINSKIKEFYKEVKKYKIEDGLKYDNLKKNILISEIPKENENIFKGVYERPEKYVSKNKTRKVKKIYK